MLCCTQTTSHLHSEAFSDGALQACNHGVLLYLLSALAWMTDPVGFHLLPPCQIICIPHAGALPILIEANQRNRSHTAGCTAFDKAFCTDHFNWEWSPITAATCSTISHSLSLTNLIQEVKMLAKCTFYQGSWNYMLQTINYSCRGFFL